MPLFITSLENRSAAQRITVRFPGDEFLFTLAPGSLTNLGQQNRRQIPVLDDRDVGPLTAIVIVVAIFPGLNWYLWSRRDGRVWLKSDTDPATRVTIPEAANPNALNLILESQLPAVTGGPALTAALH